MSTTEEDKCELCGEPFHWEMSTPSYFGSGGEMSHNCLAGRRRVRKPNASEAHLSDECKAKSAANAAAYKTATD